jgi:hypothetical protein
MPVHAFLENKAAKTERALLERLERLEGAPATLREAMAYSLMAGGKRLRPALCLGAAELVSGDDAPALPAACALEMIHTYSLIHDDLPSMDDDDLRRGKPTSHKVYGEAIAILAGDALLTLAFETAAESGRPDVVAEIARAAGAEGMVGGQVIDLESEEKRLAVTQLRRLHACKTGALIRASVRCGAMLGGADAAQFEALTPFRRTHRARLPDRRRHPGRRGHRGDPGQSGRRRRRPREIHLSVRGGARAGARPRRRDRRRGRGSARGLRPGGRRFSGPGALHRRARELGRIPFSVL